MRSTLISIILFSLLLCGIIINGIYVHNVSSQLTQYADKLSPQNENTLSELEDYWSTNKNRLGISISGAYLDGVEKTIISMRSAYDEGDEVEFRKNIHLLRQSAETIKRSERISLDAIL